MSELKKIDYRELGKEASEEAPQETQQEAAPAAQAGQAQQPAAPETLVGVEKASFFASLTNKWGLMDKKMKIEVGVFILIIFLIIAVIVYYFNGSRAPKIELPPEALNLPEENEPPNTAPEYEYTVPEL